MNKKEAKIYDEGYNSALLTVATWLEKYESDFVHPDAIVHVYNDFKKAHNIFLDDLDLHEIRNWEKKDS